MALMAMRTMGRLGERYSSSISSSSSNGIRSTASDLSFISPSDSVFCCRWQRRALSAAAPLTVMPRVRSDSFSSFPSSSSSLSTNSLRISPLFCIQDPLLRATTSSLLSSGFVQSDFSVSSRRGARSLQPLKKKPSASSPNGPFIPKGLEQFVDMNYGAPPLTDPAKIDYPLHDKVVQFLKDNKAEELVSITMKRGVCRWASHFIIVTGKSARHLKALCQGLATEFRKSLPEKLEFQVDPQSEDWNIVKFDGVVVHIFSPKAREYYDLEGLWTARNSGLVSDYEFGEDEEQNRLYEEEEAKSRRNRRRKKGSSEGSPLLEDDDDSESLKILERIRARNKGQPITEQEELPDIPLEELFANGEPPPPIKLQEDHAWEGKEMDPSLPPPDLKVLLQPRRRKSKK